MLQVDREDGGFGADKTEEGTKEKDISDIGESDESEIKCAVGQSLFFHVANAKPGPKLSIFAQVISQRSISYK